MLDGVTLNGKHGERPVELAAAFLSAVRLDDATERRRRVGELTEKSIKASGRGVDLTQVDLSGLDLTGLDLRQAVLNRTSLYGSSLAGADLSGASLVCAGLERSDFSDATLRGAYVHAMSAQASKFANADMTNLVDATGSMFHGCDLSGARFTGSELAGTTFYQCRLVGTVMSEADIRGVTFNESTMDGANLSGSRVDDSLVLRSGVRGLDLTGATGAGLVVARPSSADRLRLTDACLPLLRLSHMRSRGVAASGLHAEGIDVAGGHLLDADFSGSDLSRSRWSNVVLEDVDLSGASLAESSWLNVSARGLRAERARGEGWTVSECALPSAVLTGFTGRYSMFRNCDMRSADLRGAYLYRATIVGDPPATACLVGANLDGANLTQAYLAADFTDATMRGGWATYARVNQSVFTNADLSGTSLFRASAVKTVFTGARLDGQRGLLLADRSPGLADALADSGDQQTVEAGALVGDLTVLLARDKGKST